MVTWDFPGHGHSTAVAREHLTIDIAVDALPARALGDGPPADPRRRARGTPLVHYARSAAGRCPGASLQARVLGQVMQLAVENGAVDRVFAREAGNADPSGASFRLIRSGFGADPDPAQVLFVRDMAASVPPSVRADTFRAMTGFDLRPRLAELRTPTLHAIGDRDRPVSAREIRELGRLIPGATVEEIEGAGHALFLERHERFSDLVARFAARRLRPPARSANGRAKARANGRSNAPAPSA